MSVILRLLQAAVYCLTLENRHGLYINYRGELSGVGGPEAAITQDARPPPHSPFL
jgi:hypothetical protein